MRVHRVFGLMTVFLLAGEMSIARPASVQASKQSIYKPSVTYTHAYQPPKMGLPGRREGAGTR